jgi:hypothetical protein
MMNGQIRADNQLSELEATSDAILVLQEEVGDLKPTLLELEGVQIVELMQRADGYPAYRIHGQADLDICPAIYNLARQKDWPVRELRHDAHTLETVFNDLATTV